MSSTIDRILADPAWHDVLAILKGARNGFVYGVKIRFPHALVMTMLFSNKPWPQKIRLILRATRQHALNLARFVTGYKVLLLLQKKLNRGKERDMDTFWAGLGSGWWVFGERNAINEQIVLYVSSRVLASFIPRLLSAITTHPSPIPRAQSPSLLQRLTAPLQPLPHPLPPLTSAAANPRPLPPADAPFAVFAALSWGLVMYVYRHHGERLQPGMVNSMSYLYRDSEKWNSLRTLLWHNK